ncbi:sigma 54-interacting transcriptional regulator [Halocella sp. SP3-1]|uniref:sigma-54-dependent Fis family transcriptional regulator n=1 Tax=Halocella sp. SP3-1 TaxID=2382161 RepID=UPI000F7549AF|nr:sigma 54-interacting transcriptional regulator [Halocella sp. SP3-1]AZO96028.1 PAS domain-containing protein [Halocella sp. SP3-1]
MNNLNLSDKKEYIINSHKRCKDYNVNVDRVFSGKIIDENELFEKLEAKRELIVTAEPFMNQLYNFVKGSNFFSILTDEEGCILSVIGDEDILSEAFSFKMIPGAYMDEVNIGTNAMGTALVEGQAVQISGKEHFIKVYHRWTCSATPIRNTKGEIIASLDLTGYSESVHSHTLGMVVAAANAIEKMLEIKKYTEELSMAKMYTETVIDSIKAGILTVDLAGNIITVNSYVADMFGYKSDKMRKMKIWDLFEGWEEVKTTVSAKQNFMEEEVFVNARKNKLQFNLSTYPILDYEENVRNIIFVFKEVKKVRKLANKIMGRQAIYTFDKIIGKDEDFQRMVKFAKKVSDSRSNILIMGESGTGKELFAQAIHNCSNRSQEPFVAINCGAIPRNLIESELFGYEEGAFTGAKSSGQPGKFEIADGGTIFLDEIGEMPLDMQTRLLRVIEEDTVSRIGSIKENVVNVRVIAATNKDLYKEVQNGNFRKDLFYRLNVLPVRLPPLRERKEDIPLLFEFFMKTKSKKMNKRSVKTSEEFIKTLVEYEWPGNVRELENLVEWMINMESVPDKIGGRKTVLSKKSGISFKTSVLKDASAEIGKDLSLAAVEKEHIIKVLNLYDGNISKSAKALNIGRNTLYRKIENYKIDCSVMEQCSNI